MVIRIEPTEADTSLIPHEAVRVRIDADDVPVKTVLHLFSLALKQWGYDEREVQKRIDLITPSSSDFENSNPR